MTHCSRPLLRLTGWATIPDDIVGRLTRDQQAATPPTPLQRWAHQLFAGTGESSPGRTQP